MSLRDHDIEMEAGTGDSGTSVDSVNGQVDSGGRDNAPRRLPAWLRSLRNRWHNESPDLLNLKIRSLDDFHDGYPNLAIFQASDESFGIYRRFAYLQSRLLLEKQDILRVLEERLDQYDDDDRGWTNTRELSPDRIRPREDLLQEIEQAFNSYAALLTSSQQLTAFNRPVPFEYRSVRNYLKYNQPLVPSELEYILHKDDLLTLRSSRPLALLDKILLTVLRLIPLRWVSRFFTAPETRLKTDRHDNIWFSEERISVCSTYIILSMVIVVLVVPSYLLFDQVRSQQGTLDMDSKGACAIIILVATLIFSYIMRLFARLQKYEILGAAAAYCAVLITFLQTMLA